MVKVEQVENLEDCLDVVYTSEELKELGIDRCWGGGVSYFRTNIKNDINEQLGKIKKGNKSIKCDNVELISFLKDGDRFISDFVDGTRRVGDRIFKYEKKEVVQKKPSYSNWCSLLYIYCGLVEGLDMNISHNCCDKVKFVESFKKLLSWKKVCEINPDLKENEWVKMLYDNPSSY